MNNHLTKGIILLLINLILLSCNSEDEGMPCPSSWDNPSETYSAGHPTTGVTSTKITIEQAQEDLESLIADIDMSTYKLSAGKQISESYSLPILNDGSRAATSDTFLIHIFNFENEGGFAIMSGDVRFPALIAYAEKGKINRTQLVVDQGFALFLEGAENKYKEVVYQKFEVDRPMDPSTPSAPTGYEVYGEWKNYVYKVNGYCPVKWGQDTPYNNYCPLKNGKKTLTGCVATSIAQLMAVYTYPLSHNGYFLSWNEMIEHKYGSSCSQVGQDNIARLMQQLGTKENLDVDYGNDSSGAKTENSIRTFRNFGYSNPGVYSKYVKSTVISELKNGYSIIMSGFSSKKKVQFLGFTIKEVYEGGHQWLAHGLLERYRDVKHYNVKGELVYTTRETQSYPLCNWGWNGYRDGYYLNEAFDTMKDAEFDDDTESSRSFGSTNGDTPYNYKYRLSTITGIRK